MQSGVQPAGRTAIQCAGMIPQHSVGKQIKHLNVQRRATQKVAACASSKAHGIMSPREVSGKSESSQRFALAYLSDGANQTSDHNLAGRNAAFHVAH